MAETRDELRKQALDHVDRARSALGAFHMDSFNAKGVLVRSVFDAAPLQLARDELTKAIAALQRAKEGA